MTNITLTLSNLQKANGRFSRSAPCWNKSIPVQLQIALFQHFRVFAIYAIPPSFAVAALYAGTAIISRF